MIPREAIAFQWLMNTLNAPYKWGGSNPLEGFDCSGLVVEFHKSFGLVGKDFDATAQVLFSMHKKEHPQDIKKCKFGDLVFYGRSEKNITHVGICLDDLLMLEAGGGGSRTINRQKAEEHGAWVRLRPIQSRKDIVGYGRPIYPW
jgi:cell wall-associated NlpC family hydrolase